MSTQFNVELQKTFWTCLETCELPVGLVQDEPANSTEGDAKGVFNVIHQTSRSRNQDVDSFTKPEEKMSVSQFPLREQLSTPADLKILMSFLIS